jgi:hypothetical protein
MRLLNGRAVQIRRLLGRRWSLLLRRLKRRGVGARIVGFWEMRVRCCIRGTWGGSGLLKSLRDLKIFPG